MCGDKGDMLFVSTCPLKASRQKDDWKSFHIHTQTKLDLKGSYPFSFPFSPTNLAVAPAEQLAYGRVTSPTLT